MTQDLILSWLEFCLRATYLDDLTPGHTGARLARFRQEDGTLMVAKFSVPTAIIAVSDGSGDIRDNIRGYESMNKLGAGVLVPPSYQVMECEGVKVLVMKFLGDSFRTSVGSHPQESYVWIRDHLRVVLRNTLYPALGDLPVHSIQEIRRSMMRFGKEVDALTDGALGEHLRVPWDLESGQLMLMLLDFTPDNVFVTRDRLSMIDPWGQSTYLGNPAVSIGQFITLAEEVYGLPGAGEGCGLLRRFAFQEIPESLECSAKSVQVAFRLGVALQYILSAYVRIRTESELARAFANRAVAVLKSVS